MDSLNPHAPPLYGFNYYYIHQQPFVPLVYFPTYPVSETTRVQRRHGGVIPFLSSSTTTVMVKNIPNQLRRGDLLRILKRHCGEENRKRKGKAALYSDGSKSMFDFVSLPLDFRRFSKKKTISNLGYAFVNFTTPVAAQRFYHHFHNREWKNVAYNKKTCQITSAKIQRALKETFENKIFWCRSEECLPVIVEPACDGFDSPRVCPVGRLSDPWV